jgi:hypothetical protein
VGSNTCTVSYDQNGGDEVTISIAAVPEPDMLGVLGLAEMPMLLPRRCRKNAKNAVERLGSCLMVYDVSSALLLSLPLPSATFYHSSFIILVEEEELILRIEE